MWNQLEATIFTLWLGVTAIDFKCKRTKKLVIYKMQRTKKKKRTKKLVRLNFSDNRGSWDTISSGGAQWSKSIY